MTDAQVSLCIPSSAISETNASNLEHITHIAYQIAKAATIYNVAEIVTLEIPTKDDMHNQAANSQESQINVLGDSVNKKIRFNTMAEDNTRKKSDDIKRDSFIAKNESNAHLLASLLQYFVTPKYLVKSVFPKSQCMKKFKYADKLPKLTAIPFMSSDKRGGNFKEGFTVAKKAPKSVRKNKKSSAIKKLRVTKYVNIGESKLLELTGPEVPRNVRVTVDLKNKRVVSPEVAYGGTSCTKSYGYFVRLAKTVSSVFTELTFDDGYTETIYVNSDNFFGDASKSQIPEKKNSLHGKTLLVFGNIRDLDFVFKKESVEHIDSITDMFDSQMIVPKGLRIEDAAFVSLAKV